MMMADKSAADRKPLDGSKIIFHGAGGLSAKRSCPGHNGYNTRRQVLFLSERKKSRG
jgi:hypothetical protein